MNISWSYELVSFYWEKPSLAYANRACNFIKKETLAQAFHCEFCKIFKKTFIYRTPLVGAAYSKTAQVFI